MIAKLPVFVVIPCLNEESTLARTCHSLGFGLGETQTTNNCTLIIVDNGSTDSTHSIVLDIIQHSITKSVLFAYEPMRGYVPPRHRGVEIAAAESKKLNYDPDDVLIIQADADTIYSPNYVNLMRQTSLKAGYDTLVESDALHPPNFAKDFPSIATMLSSADNKFSEIFSLPEHDVIVDDKTCGYRLGYYLQIGGLKREFFPNGDEIHAETSRLFMRMRAVGSKRLRTQYAYAMHSKRKLLSLPLFQIANAGFTRETTWNKSWETVFRHPEKLVDLTSQMNHPNLQIALEWRARNMIALFSLLPRHHALSIGSEIDSGHAIVDYLVAQLPIRSVEEVLSEPSILIWDTFNITDRLDVNIPQLSIDGIML